MNTRDVQYCVLYIKKIETYSVFREQNWIIISRHCRSPYNYSILRLEYKVVDHNLSTKSTRGTIYAHHPLPTPAPPPPSPPINQNMLTTTATHSDRFHRIKFSSIQYVRVSSDFSILSRECFFFLFMFFSGKGGGRSSFPPFLQTEVAT
jgi:hypothetical protein